MKRRKLFAISLAAMLLLGAGCGAKRANSASPSVGQPATSAGPIGPCGEAENEYWDMNMGGEDFLPAPEEPGEPDMPQGGAEGGSIYQNPQAKLIRRAELTIQTEKFDESEAALKRLTAECEGYFENASLYGGSRRDAYANRSGEYTVRVPAEKYDQFLSGTGNLGYVTNKAESSKDVGEEYFDIEARLKTQRTKQERLLALLEKAETMEDIIALESALSDVEYQIEMYSSDLRRYDALIGYSTFNVYLNEVNRVTEEVGETASLGARMAAGFQASVHGLGQGFQNFLVWVSYNVFLLVVLAAAAAAGVVIGKRKLKKLREQEKKPDGE
ncbi:DUF4349 domain-containing protein [Colidextribacter sp. OB.20]|uniref:DUF4349 domain-containing protein n=1 Tax=Colidextribacter sp. OB.20 TaxID=2304568 RepID=UPI001371638B|nr:DUF4349 domain-containing protein [Colidextribacter sp. OB.20]